MEVGWTEPNCKIKKGDGGQASLKKQELKAISSEAIAIQANLARIKHWH